jgi:polysaccharide export outer membrane protein
MNIKILVAFFLISGIHSLIYSQNDIQIGSPNGARINQQTGALFDYSNPTAVNIKVQLWGYVKYPGYYIVPTGTSINELISFAGGPTQEALLDDIRVTKIKEGVKAVILKYNYNDLMWESDIDSQINFVRLDAGDIVVIPGEPRYFLRENLSFYLSVITTLASLAALVISITK